MGGSWVALAHMGDLCVLGSSHRLVLLQSSERAEVLRLLTHAQLVKLLKAQAKDCGPKDAKREQALVAASAAKLVAPHEYSSVHRSKKDGAQLAAAVVALLQAKGASAYDSPEA